MTAHHKLTGASVIPTVRYRNVAAAVTWLQDAFAFEPHRLVKDSKGTVVYAEMKFGTGMVMVAPIQDTEFGKLMVQPDEIGGCETQICYLYVEDTAVHHARATAAGAEVVLDIESETKGRRGYSARDLEGHVWNFGSHNPWSLQTTAASARPRPRRWRKAMAAALLLAAGAAIYQHEPARDAVGEVLLSGFARVSAAVASPQTEQGTEIDPIVSRTLREVREQLFAEQQARVASDRLLKDMRDQLTQERRAREAAEQAATTAVGNREVSNSPTAPVAPQAAPHPGALKVAEIAATEARSELAKARSALQSTTEQLAQANKAKEAAERGAKDARDQLAQLRTTRETAETTAREARELAARERSQRIAAQRTLRQIRSSPYAPFPVQ